MKNNYQKSPFLQKLFRSVFFWRKGYQSDKIQENKLRNTYYTIQNKTHDYDLQKCIMMIDGRFRHGGLTDRLRGCLAVYDVCKRLKLNFYIYFTFPFNLIDYLLPNEYDYTITSDEISYETPYSQPFVLEEFDAIGESLYSKFRLKRHLKKNKNQELHVYSNILIPSKNRFHDLFKELFKPSAGLQALIDYNKQAIGTKYIAATFRFQQLLGDFKEGDSNLYHILKEEERKALIIKCKERLKDTLAQTPKDYKLLVTSDSITFLDEVSKIGRIYVIPGKVIHMNYASPDTTLFAKSFVDLYLLMDAETITLFQTGEMYNSRFPRFAAILGEKKYIHYKF